MGQVGGTMQHWALTLDKLLDRAARWHPETAIVTRLPDGAIIRSSYVELHRLAKRVSNALISAGIQPGDRVATMASNGFDHLAVWYGIMGIGAVCHTLNPRLHEDQLAYIANHAGDVMLFADGVLSPLAGKIVARASGIERIVTINDNVGDGPYPALAAFIEGSGTDCVWGGFDENTTAGLCYTSGTTGDPKGVAYTHRSNTLLAMNTITPDAFALSAQDVIMPVVPMFHANTWGLAFSAPAVGAKLVLPGPRLDGQSLHELIEGEGVTFSAGVPTVWQGYVDYLRQHGITRSSLQRVVIGGSACSAALMDAVEALGIRVIHAWGMTELSPVGLVATPTPEIKALPAAEQHEMALKQGRPLGIGARIVDDAGIVLPHDGIAVGNLEVCGPTVIDRYVGHSESALNAEGWFDTGDIATIDPFGYVRITDRAKDIIKSGGEWISSVDIENALLGHPNVALAAVIGVPHDRWGERPKLFVQLRTPASDTPKTFQAYLVGRIERWWMPDEVEIIDAIPIGATGKVDKKALRAINGTR
jgi:fatty-acyl-CoA synthase